MQPRTFDYLYFKTHGHSNEEIRQETGLSLEEIEIMEKALRPVLEEIEAERPKAKTIGADFARLTRYIYADKSDQEQGTPRPDAIKARSGEVFALPAVAKLDFGKTSLQDAILQRRSLRKYSDEPLSLQELSFLLYCSSWARDFRSNERMEITLRNVPSAGSRHPIETFVDIRRVTGLKPGLYYYHPIKHCLVLYDESPEIQDQIFEGCFRQEMIQSSAANFIYTAVPYRTCWRYGQRGYRYLYLDAGHIGQNLHLAAEAVSAGACMIGAYLDEAMNEALKIDGSEEFVIYIATVGKK
ncbi:MAG: SagB/ThcOx family dehydrogenase [Candidatus Cloacimonadaceae bacterium]|jgi:SagB-type dehydrogenase family enzyme|nr:SagB/ThcOx family dehydrogenase [Candidatus Cloacimonadota bacterium]MDY0127927.1 SagB/ThcOx family dehydrogenase [Candidatus Cloacimonadaceae bacterium]MCB5255283.1 SagB/ThcOx family dehydrogenase [Candidatus Cloacimonadota bacterium]MCK9177991.1 SagB/ThcOx family dehydrogenase [Candidatus Cloacimonadota bacterium]MCK9243189.1 SagB/ThcOx family dehydrogenase [Candidatus Cloacimonadota bacterium]